jgi:hypothetical protein
MNMEIENLVRGYTYLAAVLNNQQQDPFCGSCNAYVKTLAAVRENIALLEKDHAADIARMPERFIQRFNEAKTILADLRSPENPLSQKKAGNCKMPEGVCFVKSSLAIVLKG